MFLLGFIVGVVVCGAWCVAVVRREARRPWWRS
jgi:hypothetical protein